ncbi:MAG: glycosyltransferase [Limisphaerales bacterium]
MSLGVQSRPLVSLALISFNHGHYLTEAVQAALSQTYSPLEIILSDDRSTDESFQIMSKLVEEYPGPHKVVTNRNMKNLGLIDHVRHIDSLAKGELLVIAAGDDISLPHRVSTIVCEWFKHGNPDLIYSNLDVIDAIGRGVRQIRVGNQNLPADKVDRLQKFLTYSFPKTPGAGAAWIPGFLGRYPINHGFTSEDAVMGFRALMSNSLHFIDQSLVKYRVHNSNDSIAPKAAVITPAYFKAVRRSLQRRSANLAQHADDLEVAGKDWGLSEDIIAIYARRFRVRSAILELCSKFDESDPTFLKAELIRSLGEIEHFTRKPGLLNRLRRNLQREFLRLLAPSSQFRPKKELSDSSLR